MVALVLFIGALVVAVIAYDIYLHPVDPNPVGTATIEISGTEGIHFQGTVGTESDEYTLEGRTPVTFKTPYRRADYVTADISPAEEEKGQGTLKVEIRKVVINAKDKTVEKGQTEATGGSVSPCLNPIRRTLVRRIRATAQQKLPRAKVALVCPTKPRSCRRRCLRHLRGSTIAS